MDTDYEEVTRNIAIVIIIVLVTVLVATSIGNFFVSVIGDSAVVEASTDYQTVGDTELQNLSVAATSGSALGLDGGYVEAPADVTVNDTNSGTLMATAALASDANQSAAYSIAGADGDLILRYDDGDWLAIMANGTTTTASAPASTPEQFTTLTARYNATAGNLTLFVDGAAANTTSLGTAEQRQVANNLNGRLEEVRVFDGTVPDSAVTTYHNDPIAPLNGQTHETRLLFDEGEGASTLAFYQGQQADIVGSYQWVGGLTANAAIEAGVDYEVQGNQIRAVADSYLDGQPKLYLSFDDGAFGGLVATIFNVGPAALQLVVIGLLVMGGSAVLRQVSGFGGGGR